MSFATCPSPVQLWRVQHNKAHPPPKRNTIADGGATALTLELMELSELALGLPADARQYYTAAHILKSLGVSRLQLLSNNPAKPEALARCGLTVEKRLPLIIATNPHNETYLAAKREKFGHLLPN